MIPEEVLPINIAEITQVDLEGAGTLDVLLRSLRLNLTEEYDNNRINGPEYAQVFTDLHVAHLNAAITYSIQRQKLGYELGLLKLEGDIAEKNLLKVGAEIAAIEAGTRQTEYITTNKLPVDIQAVEAEIALTNQRKLNMVEEATLIPHQLLLLQNQAGQVTAETALVVKNTERVTEELTKIPLEAEILRKQALREDANISLITKQIEEVTLNLGKVPKEIALIEAQTQSQVANKEQSTATTARILKETELKLPIELANLTKQGTALTAETDLTVARTEEIDANTAKIPVEVAYLQAQVANMSKQNLILEKNLELKEGELNLQIQQIDLAKEELLIKKQELEVAKASVLTQKAQADLYAAKVITETAQTQGGIAQPGSIIDWNNQVLEGQVTGYKNDALQKACKVYLDAWMVGAQSEVREANSLNKLDDGNMGTAMLAMLKGAGVMP